MGQVTSNIPFSSPHGTFTEKLNEDYSSDFKDVPAPKLSFTKRVSRNVSLISRTIVETENFNDFKKGVDQTNFTAISKFEAALQLFKILIGTGILFMPKAFASVGVTLGIVLVFFMAFITIRTFEFVIAASQYFSNLNQTNSYSFSDTFRLSLEKWPSLSPYAPYGQRLVTLLIIFSCYTVCMVYVLLIAQNMEEILQLIGWKVSFKIIIIIEYPLLITLNSCTSLKRLTPITTIALISLWSGIGLTVYEISTYMATNGAKLEDEKFDFSKIPSFLSIVLFAFNGIASLTAIENNMNDPQKFIGCPSVVCIVVLLVGTIYTCYGILGYFAFGLNTEGPVSENFPPNATVNVILKICIALGLLLTCPIMLFAPLTIITEYINAKVAVGRKKTLSMLMRWLQLLVIVLVPLLIQNIMTLLKLLSSLNLILQFIIPVIIDTLTFTCVRQGGLNIINIFRNIFLLVIGLSFIGLTFYSGVRSVLEFYNVL